MHSFEVHSNESASRKKVCLGLEQVERAVHTFNDNFQAVLATVDSELPITHWVLLLTQAVMTLNMSQDSRLNPKISTYTFIFGTYDFNTTPIAPPGTKVVVRSKPYQCLTWDLNRYSG